MIYQTQRPVIAVGIGGFRDQKMLSSSWRLILPDSLTRKYNPSGFCCRAEDKLGNSRFSNNQGRKQKKVLIVGSGWAGLGAAHHLCKQGFEVVVLEGGYEFGPKNQTLSPDELGIRGFWYPYRNIFNLVDEIGIKPFTEWTKSAQYSAEGLEVQFPVFQNEPQLPSPFGTLLYSEFARVPLLDRLTLLPLMGAIIDFDNTDSAWTKYDPITARELLKQFGCSERLYRDILDPLLEVGLYAPLEQCSAAATLSVLYYYVISHQKNFDMVWCRGRVRERIFEPWMDSLKTQGCKFLKGRKVTDMLFTEETDCISEVVCEKESFVADAVIMAVGVSTLQEIIQNSAVLCLRDEFLKVLNLASVDLLSVKLQLDKKVNIPNASNVSSGFDNSHAWTFFDLNRIYDEHNEDPVTVVQADFYHATELLPLRDEKIVSKAMSYLSKCIKDFENATVIDKEIERLPKSLTNFFPGSYKYMMSGSTSFKNLFIAGDWIANQHGSWSQEKSYVTGLEAANRVVDYLGEGSFAKIIPVEDDEPHVQALRTLNRNLTEMRTLFPWSDYFLQ